MLDVVALPPARLRRRPALHVLHRRRDVRALPVPLDLPPGHPRLLAARAGLPSCRSRLRVRRAARDPEASRRASRCGCCSPSRWRSSPSGCCSCAGSSRRRRATRAAARASSSPASGSGSRTRPSRARRSGSSTRRGRGWRPESATPPDHAASRSASRCSARSWRAGSRPPLPGRSGAPAAAWRTRSARPAPAHSRGSPLSLHAAKDAFVVGLGDLMLIGCVVLAAGAICGVTLLRRPRPAAEAATESAAKQAAG